MGFIADLPHTLVEAFRATLEETLSASLLLHVIDVAADDRDMIKSEVESVLSEIGAGDIPQLIVFNKIDLLEREPKTIRNAAGEIEAVSVSAMQGLGFDQLREAIRERLAGSLFRGVIVLGAEHGKLRSELYAMGAIETERWNDDGANELTISLPDSDWQRLKNQFMPTNQEDG